MVTSPMVLGLDIATVCGFAHGRVHDKVPVWGVKRFGAATSPSSEIFGVAMKWTRELLAEVKPDIVMMEALLPPNAMQGETSRATRDRLCGLNAIMMAVAHEHGVGEIGSATVGNIRSHFVGDRTLRRATAKREVMNKCRELGWTISNDNEADACAIWHFAVSQIDSKRALETSPLFGRARIASVWP